MNHRPVLIMAGGTGGHIYPALAIADYLSARQVPVFWLGTAHGLEARLVPEKGYALHTISIGGLRGKGLMTRLLAPLKILYAIGQSLRVIRQIRPSVVLGMGGFASGPGGIAAWLSRIPLVIHEQNAIAGLTNKLLAPLASVVLQAFPNTFKPSTAAISVGNPVRAEIAQLPEPEQRWQVQHQGLHLLVLGGSLGARALNKTVPAALAELADLDIRVRHQCGAKGENETHECYRSASLQAEIEPFIADMAEAYAWADLVICRSGAMTVYELAAAGVGSILVPYPYAVDDHQHSNARYLSNNDAALIMAEEQMTADSLASCIRQLAVAGRLLEMAINARQMAVIDATRLAAEQCLELAYE